MPFCREEQLQNTRARILVHAHARVGDRELNAGSKSWPVVGRRGKQLDAVPRLQSNSAAVGHGIARVEHEVEDVLLGLAGVDFHLAEALRGIHPEFNVLPSQTSTEFV